MFQYVTQNPSIENETSIYTEDKQWQLQPGECLLFVGIRCTDNKGTHTPTIGRPRVQIVSVGMVHAIRRNFSELQWCIYHGCIVVVYVHGNGQITLTPVLSEGFRRATHSSNSRCNPLQTSNPPWFSSMVSVKATKACIGRHFRPVNMNISCGQQSNVE